jgi:hypothetical protein
MSGRYRNSLKYVMVRQSDIQRKNQSKPWVIIFRFSITF